jgi:hypothetical protein
MAQLRIDDLPEAGQKGGEQAKVIQPVPLRPRPEISSHEDQPSTKGADF